IISSRSLQAEKPCGPQHQSAVTRSLHTRSWTSAVFSFWLPACSEQLFSVFSLPVPVAYRSLFPLKLKKDFHRVVRYGNPFTFCLLVFHDNWNNHRTAFCLLE